MVYDPTDWKARVVEFPNRFKLISLGADLYTILPEPGTVTEFGTLINPDNMNKVEQALVDAVGHTEAAAPHSGHETPAGAQAKAVGAVSAHEGAANPHNQYLPKAGGTLTGALNFADANRKINKVGGNLVIENLLGSSILASKGDGVVATNAYHDGTNWQRYDTTKPSVAIFGASVDGKPYIYTASAGANPIVWQGPYEVYHAGNLSPVTSGSFTDTTTLLAQDTTHTKTIPLGKTGYKVCFIYARNSNHIAYGKGFAIGGTAPNRAIGVYSANITLVEGANSGDNYASLIRGLANGTGTTDCQYVRIKEAYISGSDLIIIFSNVGISSSKYINAIVDWVVM